MKLLRLPAGTRDKGGRALLTVSTTSPVWSHLDCDSAELPRLLLYYTSTLRYAPPSLLFSGLCAVHPLISLLSWNRKEVLASGLTVLVDARGAAPSPALYSALRSLQVSWLWLSYLETGALCCGAVVNPAQTERVQEKVALLILESLSCFSPSVVLFSRSHLEKHALMRDSISAPIKTMMQLLLMRNTCRMWLMEKHLYRAKYVVLIISDRLWIWECFLTF